MARRQELCRDFQRGNCRFGARCKYLHQLPPPPQQQQQQQLLQRPQQQLWTQQDNRRNAYQNTNSSRNRDSNANQRQQHNQNAAAKEHRCNDPRLCKQQIREDFANDPPAYWRLTSYAHYRSLPNDIVGDVSPEELRAAAYEGAKQGLSLKDVAQREASMVAAKTAEFEALLKNPYGGPATQFSSGFQPGPFTASPFVTPFQTSSPFTPVGPPTGFPTASPPQVFTQPPYNETPSSTFRFDQPSGTAPYPFPLTNQSSGNPSPFTQPTSLFQESPFPFPSPAAPKSVFPTQPGSNTASSMTGFQSPFTFPNVAAPQAIVAPLQSPPGLPSLAPTAENVLTPAEKGPPPNVPAVVAQTAPMATSQQAVLNNAQNDSAIWQKDVWKIGEIPEGEPPQEVRF